MMPGIVILFFYPGNNFPNLFFGSHRVNKGQKLTSFFFILAFGYYFDGSVQIFHSNYKKGLNYCLQREVIKNVLFQSGTSAVKRSVYRIFFYSGWNNAASVTMTL